MENVYPIYEKVEFEEIYGKKRPNASPVLNTPTFMFDKLEKTSYKYTSGVKYKWFKKEEISQYEKNYFLETNNYLEIRNYIIEKYEACMVFVTLNEICKELKNFNFMQIYRIYTFLDKLKIINNRDVIQECTETIKNIDFLVENKQTTDCVPVFTGSGKCKCEQEGDFFSKNNIFICKKCLTCGDYPENMNTSDFYRIEKEVINKIWSKKEEIRLLEAIEKFGDDWTSVSNYVETKSKQECIYHFIMIPLLEVNLSNIGFATHMPFLLSSNPVTHLLVFLSSVVHPSVAASVAKMCIKEISNSSHNLLKTMLIEAKRKALEIIELENKKIKRINDVIDECLTNLILLKVKNLKRLFSSFEVVKDELIEARKKL